MHIQTLEWDYVNNNIYSIYIKIFHFIYYYYKNKFLYKSPHEGVLTSYVIYLPTYLRFKFFIIEGGHHLPDVFHLGLGDHSPPA